MGRVENKRVAAVIQLLVEPIKPLSLEVREKLGKQFAEEVVNEFLRDYEGYDLDTHGFAEWYALKLAKATSTVPQLLHDLVLRINNPKLWLEVAENPRCDVETLELLIMLKCDCSTQIRWAAAKSPKANKALLKKLVICGGFETCRLVMNHPNVEVEILWFMVDTMSVRDLKKFATDPKTPPMMLHIMAWKQGGELAEDVANNFSTPERTLRRLLNSKNPVVRMAARNNLEVRNLY